MINDMTAAPMREMATTFCANLVGEGAADRSRDHGCDGKSGRSSAAAG
jgi:hypothetical protein